ncbi:hypothetical protein GPECTOR_7g978 [Gonium pectorale]|uniref:EF-hand domain-containing protein n=1 Tax=Gonium pectorale TaxID=33097 RepID=A0A150GV08_GONPE|nr:hypothetical protein GPECTOR_7g978 [Gonium pectorale]|eukprot:KXZ53528.1 hypothetical protein GPECTOR_7g978 [Gonium pectorale]
MAQLATAWAEVSSRLTPGTPLTTSRGMAAAADMTAPPAPSGGGGSAEATHGRATAVGGCADGGSAASGGGRLGEAAAPAQLAVPDRGSLAALQQVPPLSSQLAAAPHHHAHHQQQQQQQHQHQQQQQHFEAIITALKLALSSLQACPPRADGRTPATRAVQLASSLADLVAAGLPLDADSLCAGVVAEAAALGALGHERIEAALGRGVAALVHDMLRVRQAPRRIELLDDEGASAVREWCLAFHDVRACVVEVVNCWDELQHMGAMPLFEQQALALEALQICAPLGHALGLGPLSTMMEDACLKVLFPDSYAATSSWLRGLMAPAEEGLFAAQQARQCGSGVGSKGGFKALLSELEGNLEFGQLAGGLVVKARAKSLFSVMKKLLHLGDMAKGGRSREELYDLLGMRAIVQPADFLPPGEAEAAATRACYIVQEVACRLWRPLPGRSKDYIVAPKANGYQSIHLTLELSRADVVFGGAAAAGRGTGGAAAAGSDPLSDFTCSSSSSDEGNSPSRDRWQQPPLPAAASAATSVAAAAASPDISAFTGFSSVNTFSSVSSYDAPPEPAGLGPGKGPGAAPARGLPSAASSASGGSGDGSAVPLYLELQIRTSAMDKAAESGDASHALYKGGLDARTARQLQLFSLDGSVDEGDEGGPLLIGLPHRDAVAAAEQLFRALDANGDGRLSLGEVRQALADLASPASERDAAALVAALDANGDGNVSCEEFVDGLRRATEQQQDRERERREREEEEQERARRERAAARRRQQPQWPQWPQRL